MDRQTLAAFSDGVHSHLIKEATLRAFVDELEKISAASGIDIEELLKQAGIFSRMGSWMQQKGVPGAQNLYNRAQVGTGDLMMRYGHGLEHGLGETMLTTSPGKGMAAALLSDPHLRADVGRVTGLTAAGKAIGRSAKKGYKATVKGMGKLKPAPGGGPRPPMGGVLVPAAA